MLPQPKLELVLQGMEVIDKRRANIKRVLSFLKKFPLDERKIDDRKRQPLWKVFIDACEEHVAFQLWMSAPYSHTGYHAYFWLDVPAGDGVGVCGYDLIEHDIPFQFVPKTWGHLNQMVTAVTALSQDAQRQIEFFAHQGRIAQP